MSMSGAAEARVTIQTALGPRELSGSAFAKSAPPIAVVTVSIQREAFGFSMIGDYTHASSAWWMQFPAAGTRNGCILLLLCCAG